MEWFNLIKWLYSLIGNPQSIKWHASWNTRGCLNINTLSYQNRNYHYKGKTVAQPSYIYTGNPRTSRDVLYIETGPRRVWGWACMGNELYIMPPWQISCTPYSSNAWNPSQIDELVQERRNSSALAMELRLSCTNPSRQPCLWGNEHHGISNYLHIDCLLNSLLRLSWEMTGGFPAPRSSNGKSTSILWCHYNDGYIRQHIQLFKMQIEPKITFIQEELYMEPRNNSKFI